MTDVARRDEDVPQTSLAGQSCTVRHIFQIGQWLGIGVGNARTVVLQAEVDDLLRGEVVVSHFVWRHLRDVVVLAVHAAEVTPRAGYRQTRGAGMEMVERLLFNGINGQRTGLPIDLTDEHAILIPATATDSRLTIGNTTMMRTEHALHPPVV